MTAIVQVAGWEAWCHACLDGSGVTTKDEAKEWARKHNERVHIGGFHDSISARSTEGKRE